VPSGIQVHVNGSTSFDAYNAAFDTAISGSGTQHQVIEATDIVDLTAGDLITVYAHFGGDTSGSNPGTTQTIGDTSSLAVTRVA
jgi:hypothetical protein